MAKLYPILCVALGASIGGVLRYESYLWMARYAVPSHYATLCINLFGSFFIGVLFVYFNSWQNSTLQLLCVTGLLGAFTTFSTFSLDTLKLLTAGHYSSAVVYIFLQLLFGLSFCLLGIKLGEYLFH